MARDVIIEQSIEELLGAFAAAAERCETIPGISAITARRLVAEVGICMEQFPSSVHLASWGGLCSGNNESAGKQVSGRNPTGNRWFKQTLSRAGLGCLPHASVLFCGANTGGWQASAARNEPFWR